MRAGISKQCGKWRRGISLLRGLAKAESVALQEIRTVEELKKMAGDPEGLLPDGGSGPGGEDWIPVGSSETPYREVLMEMDIR